MIKISNTRVYGLEESLIASGYPMLTKPLSRKEFGKDVRELKHPSTDLKKTPEFKRGVRLGQVKTGSGHDNFLKGIIVQFDIEYPMYFSPQLQRYNWIDIVSSMSKMHKLLKILQEENKPLEEVLQTLPASFPLTMRISTNYLQLKTIYYQRNNHKLVDDWGVFTDWILTLRYFKELIGIK